MPEKREQRRQNLKNKKYEQIITAESDTIKHLYKMLSPKMANFAKARKEIEPFDDLNALRETQLDKRLANLRQQIYKNRKEPVAAAQSSLSKKNEK